MVNYSPFAVHGPNERVPRSAISACQATLHNDHLLYICTGRARVHIPERIAALGFDGIISSGGGQIEAQGSILAKVFLGMELTRRVVDYFIAHQKGFMLELDGSLIAGPYLIPFFHNLIKGAALEQVAAHHSDTIAFGDSDNDRTMLAAAGIGVAMGNADESLKAHADYVTDRLDRDGLAKAFARYHLG
jgi:hydroxymethylpyrimidine pyrophosphatase-like HAD family hydrolase